MTVLQVLDEKYLRNLIKQLNVEKRKFKKAFKKFRAKSTPYHTFIVTYCIPLVNIKMKIEEFKEYFDELNVKYPKLPEFDEDIHTTLHYVYQNDTIVEDFTYKGEIIDIEYDHVTTTIDPWYFESTQEGQISNLLQSTSL